jgi:predicted transcriptional regulator
MKTITINVSEPVYREFQAYARLHDRSASELVRQAMEEFHRTHLQPAGSLRDLSPVSLGKVLRPLSAGDDLLEDMLDETGR